ncbi:MAG: PH domain-containing protein [Proteobacteria bacterium]|nr:PH domain-containing protein [Pseudomonadota bacterium]
MTKKYESKKDWRMGVVVFIIPLMLWGLMPIIPNLYLFFIALVVTSLFTWIWFDTNYRMDTEYLIYKSGPFRGKIPINNIKEINPRVRDWSGTRPALSFEYLRIKYNTYDDIFIAPKDEGIFIEDIKNKNPNILITK